MLHGFIINPRAGRPGMAQRAVRTIEESCRRLGLTHEITVTESAGDAARITAHYAQSGREVRLYACGGDGTLNQIVQTAAGQDHMAVTNIPMGTGNDFLKLFGPTCKTAFWDLDALAEGPQAALDLIDCNGLLGLDIVCAGVDARIARDVHDLPASGMGAYVLSLLCNVAFRGIAQEMRVSMGDRTWEESITLLCVCNGRYYGGGFMPVGDAMPDDGVLDCLLVPKVSRLTFARLVGDYAKGRYAKYPDLIHPYHGAGPITLEADAPITMCIDGEIVENTRFTLGLSAKKLNFFWPQGLDYRVKAPIVGN